MRISRFFGAVVAASVMSIGLSGVVAADSVYGQTGHYLFTDSTNKPGARCLFTNVSPNMYSLYRISVRPPSVWWPDTSSSSDTQHGPVGWQVVIRHRHAGSTSWLFLKQSTIQRAIAYEDHPLYDPADDAPFTRIALDIHAAAYPSDEQYRVNVRAIWFKKPYDGTVMGYAIHPVMNYAQVTDGFNQGLIGTSYCPGGFNAG